MQLIAPVTDYIPASMLTTVGDMVVRGAVAPERLAKAVDSSNLISGGGPSNPTWSLYTHVLNQYYKSREGVQFPAFSALALRDGGFHIGDDWRDSPGDQVITGVGFETSLVIFLAMATGGGIDFSIGFDTGTIRCLYAQRQLGATATMTDNHSISLEIAGGNWIRGLITAVGADGFTITWTENGVADVTFYYICLP